MSFLAPGFLIAAASLSALVVLLHFLNPRERIASPLPTARFAPARPTRARARIAEPRHLLVLALRVALLVAVGAGLAGPVRLPTRRGVARVVLLDRSHHVDDRDAAREAARRMLTDRDVLVLFDSAATVVRSGVRDSLDAFAAMPRPGRLSPALITGLRTAWSLRDAADSLELAIVSPLAVEELDEASDSVRAVWPGAIRLMPTLARNDSSVVSSVAIRGADDDPLRVSVRGKTGDEGSSPVRIVRSTLTSDDSAWVRAGPRVVVHWPAVPAGPRTALGRSWTARGAPDTVGAVLAGDAVVVAPLERLWTARPSASVNAIARWADGEVAAIEERVGLGCIRSVAVNVPSAGDLVLQPRFARFVGALTAPCGGSVTSTPLPASRVAALAGSGTSLVPARALAPAQAGSSPLAKWLLLLAAMFGIAEQLVRRRAAVGSVGGSS